MVSSADTFLPLIVADAMRPDLTPEEEEKAEKEGKVRRETERAVPALPWDDVWSHCYLTTFHCVGIKVFHV